MKEKFNDFITDYYKTGMVILDLLVLASMSFKPDFEWNVFNIYSLIARSVFPFIVFFFGYKGMWIFYFITAIVKTLDITFDDFTALTVFCILFLFIKPKYKWLRIPTVITYLVCIFLVAGLHHKQPYHLFAHFIGCCMLCLTVYKLAYNKKSLFSKKEKQKLDLTYDETLILDELLKGKRQKEIEFFSENTVSDKLKQARLRNNVKYTDDLLIMYKENKIHSEF